MTAISSTNEMQATHQHLKPESTRRLVIAHALVNAMTISPNEGRQANLSKLRPESTFCARIPPKKRTMMKEH